MCRVGVLFPLLGPIRGRSAVLPCMVQYGAQPAQAGRYPARVLWVPAVPTQDQLIRSLLTVAWHVGRGADPPTAAGDFEAKHSLRLGLLGDKISLD